jgi:hypothetical protein
MKNTLKISLWRTLRENFPWIGWKIFSGNPENLIKAAVVISLHKQSLFTTQIKKAMSEDIAFPRQSERPGLAVVVTPAASLAAAATLALALAALTLHATLAAAAATLCRTARAAAVVIVT